MTIVGAKELINSSLWKEVESELQHRADSLMQSLMTCPVEDLAEIRIKILALGELANLPQTVIEREE